jgi:hypothetical protein
MRFLRGSDSGWRNRALSFLLGVLAVIPYVNAASDPGTSEAVVMQASDDREDDVVTFFQSGECKKRLSIPLITIGLLGVLAAVAGLAVKRSTL